MREGDVVSHAVVCDMIFSCFLERGLRARARSVAVAYTLLIQPSTSTPSDHNVVNGRDRA